MTSLPVTPFKLKLWQLYSISGCAIISDVLIVVVPITAFLCPESIILMCRSSTWGFDIIKTKDDSKTGSVVKS